MPDSPRLCEAQKSSRACVVVVVVVVVVVEKCNHLQRILTSEMQPKVNRIGA